VLVVPILPHKLAIPMHHLGQNSLASMSPIVENPIYIYHVFYALRTHIRDCPRRC
jgi:hypothetical protein